MRPGLLQTQGQQMDGKLTTSWLVGSDVLKEQRRFGVVFIAPNTADAPLPPGVERWPGPGEAVLSLWPAEGRLSPQRESPAVTGSSLAPSGRRGWRIRARVALACMSVLLDGMKPQAPIESVVGFATAGSVLAEGLQPGSARDDDKPEGTFRAVVIGLLLVPSLVLLFIALRTGSHGRDRRSALVDALGGRRRDRALIAVGEAMAGGLRRRRLDSTRRSHVP